MTRRTDGSLRRTVVTARKVALSAALALFTVPASAYAACVCLNNASIIDFDANTGGDDGQFSERILVNAPDGQTWRVTAATGAYDAFDIPPLGTQSDLVPIPSDGSVLMKPGPLTNQYYLDIVHIDAVAYSITVTNQAGTSLTIENTCRYPNPVFSPEIRDSYQVTDPPVTLGVDVSSGPALASVTFEIDAAPATQLIPLDLAPVPAKHVVQLAAVGSVGANGFQDCEQRGQKGFFIYDSRPAPALDPRFGAVLVMALVGFGVRALRRR